jgi:acyl-homoserine lactone acylase PvdQ
VLLLLLLLLLAVPVTAESVEIIRDAYGTPHIFSTTPAGAAFGAGYAQAEDRPAALLKNLALPAEPTDLSPDLRAMLDAYAAGVNSRLGEPRVTVGQVAAFARRAYSSIHGSNDLFLPPSRTASKSVIAILDPLADWNAPTRPYEMSLYASASDLSIAGVAPPGMPFPIVGHSQHIAIGWSGDPAQAGPRAIEEAWSLITAHTLDDLRRALAMNQIQGRPACATATGDLCPQNISNTNPVTEEALRVQQTWSRGRVESLAFNTEVYKADLWQRLLARLTPDSRFARLITAWNRRADADSRAALAFYLFKMELTRDASLPQPPDSLSETRIRAALTRAQDRLETQLDFNANWGSEFRLTRDNSRASFPAAGGILPEAGIATPRTLYFTNNRAHSGQSAPRIVELSKTPSATSILLPGVSDDPASLHFEDQSRLTKPKPTYFRNRRDLERAATSRKKLDF